MSKQDQQAHGILTAAGLNLGRYWRKRIKRFGHPEGLPRGYEHLAWHPFGIAQWNAAMQQAARIMGYNPPDCPDCTVRICPTCDAGDPTSVIPYHTPEECEAK